MSDIRHDTDHDEPSRTTQDVVALAQSSATAVHAAHAPTQAPLPKSAKPGKPQNVGGATEPKPTKATPASVRRLLADATKTVDALLKKESTVADSAALDGEATLAAMTIAAAVRQLTQLSRAEQDAVANAHPHEMLCKALAELDMRKRRHHWASTPALRKLFTAEDDLVQAIGGEHRHTIGREGDAAQIAQQLQDQVVAAGGQVTGGEVAKDAKHAAPKSSMELAYDIKTLLSRYFDGMKDGVDAVKNALHAPDHPDAPEFSRLMTLALAKIVDNATGRMFSSATILLQAVADASGSTHGGRAAQGLLTILPGIQKSVNSAIHVGNHPPKAESYDQKNGFAGLLRERVVNAQTDFIATFSTTELQSLDTPLLEQVQSRVKEMYGLGKRTIIPVATAEWLNLKNALSDDRPTMGGLSKGFTPEHPKLGSDRSMGQLKATGSLELEITIDADAPGGLPRLAAARMVGMGNGFVNALRNASTVNDMRVEELDCLQVYRIGHVAQHWQKLIALASPTVPLNINYASRSDRLMIAAARARKHYPHGTDGYLNDASLTPASDAEMVAYIKGLVDIIKKAQFMAFVTHAS